MFLGKDLADISIADIDHDLLHTTGVNRGIWNYWQLGSPYRRIGDNHADIDVVWAVLVEILCVALDFQCRNCAECVFPILLRKA